MESVSENSGIVVLYFKSIKHSQNQFVIRKNSKQENSRKIDTHELTLAVTVTWQWQIDMYITQ